MTGRCATVRAALAAAAVVSSLGLAACTGSASDAHSSSASDARSSSASTRPPATSSTTASPARPTPSGPPPPRTVTILGSGDVLIHPALWEQAHRDAHGHGYDFGPMYASIAPDVRRADIAICEMESPLAPPQGPFTGWPQFSSPPQVLTALTGVGYDSCTTASNHSIDEGYEGVHRTLDELDAAGLRHTGSARSAAEAQRPLIMTTDQGVKVASLAYSFGFNGLTVPANQPWLANLTDIPTILAAAHRAKQAGADIVVLSLHWGVEYNLRATQEQRDEAAQLLASPDIDVILGDHPHVVEPAQRLHGKWVFYSMGNQISRHENPVLVSRQGVMPMVTFTERGGHFVTTRAEAVPTLMRLTPQLRLIDLKQALADPATAAADRTAYRASVAQIRSTLDAYGAGGDGLLEP